MSNIQLAVHDGRATTTTLVVAERFGKRHDDVLKAVRGLDCSPEFRLRNFAETPYIHPQNGQQYPMIEMSRDGFMLSVMGFTGPEATRTKEGFIAAFNDMEAQLRSSVRPGQVEALRLERLAQVLSREVLRQKPWMHKLVRYRRLGLSVREISKLLRKSQQTLEDALRLLEASGHLPPPDAARLARRETARRNLALAQAKLAEVSHD